MARCDLHEHPSTPTIAPHADPPLPAEDDWYTHVSMQGRVVEWADDEGLTRIDELSRHDTGRPYPVRDRERASAWIEVDRRHGWGSAEAGDDPEN